MKLGEGLIFVNRIGGCTTKIRIGCLILNFEIRTTLFDCREQTVFLLYPGKEIIGKRPYSRRLPTVPYFHLRYRFQLAIIMRNHYLIWFLRSHQ